MWLYAHKTCAEASLEAIAAGAPPDPYAPPLTDHPAKERRATRVSAARRARPAARPQPQLFPGT